MIQLERVQFNPDSTDQLQQGTMYSMMYSGYLDQRTQKKLDKVHNNILMLISVISSCIWFLTSTYFRPMNEKFRMFSGNFSLILTRQQD